MLLSYNTQVRGKRIKLTTRENNKLEPTVEKGTIKRSTALVLSVLWNLTECTGCMLSHRVCMASHRVCSVSRDVCTVSHEVCVVSHGVCIVSHGVCVVNH